MDRCISELDKHLRRFTSMSAEWRPSEQLEHAREAARQLSLEVQRLADCNLNASGRYGHRGNLQQWRRTFYYLKGLLNKARGELDNMKKGAILPNCWLVGVGLSDPRTSLSRRVCMVRGVRT